MNSHSFFSEEELRAVGFKHVGKDVRVSRFARFYGVEKMEIGDHSRIDDFCILSGQIQIGRHVHISAYCALYGRFGIVFGDFSGASARCTLYSAVDDFSGDFLIGPTIPDEFTQVSGGKVVVSAYVQIGANSVVFPDLVLGEGVVVGALSLVKGSLEPWGMYAGIPARRIKERNKGLLNLGFHPQ